MNEKMKAFYTKYKTPILLGVAAIALYLGYRWYQNRNSGTGNLGTSSTTGTGSNLNSLAPELVAGSAGPASGLNYYAGTTSVNLAQGQNSPSQVNQVPTDNGPDQETMSDQDTGSEGTPDQWTSHPAGDIDEARTMPRALNTAPGSTSMAVKRTPAPQAKGKPATKLDAHQLHLAHLAHVASQQKR